MPLGSQTVEPLARRLAEMVPICRPVTAARALLAWAREALALYAVYDVSLLVAVV